MSDFVTLVEVGPRDGLQNEQHPLATTDKVALIQRLAETGLRVIEAGALVSPKAVPQMADSADVLRALDLDAGVRYPVLVPNEKGLQRALQAGVREIAVFAAASDSFSQKNIGCDVAASLERYQPVVEQARAAGCRVRGYVSCVMGCPYEGKVPLSRVVEVSRALAGMGCDEISLGDTIGSGNPRLTRQLIQAVAAELPLSQLAVHFHDTWGMAVANVYQALELGIRIVDCAVAGLGGCPYAPGATGNVATEEIVHLCTGLGLETGVDLRALAETGWWLSNRLGRPPASRVSLALRARC